MKQKPSSRRKHSSAKSVLRLPDLELAKAAVLNSLNSMDARSYRHAIDELDDWYCSEPRLAFNRIRGLALWLSSRIPSTRPRHHQSEVLGSCADSPTKRPTAVFSAPIWRRVFVESRG
jgi:hypothetical protein